jgi:hypothetical protein
MSRLEAIRLHSLPLVIASFERLPNIVLDLLAGRPEADWHRAPPAKWTPAQIAEHLAISLVSSAAKFDERRSRPSMTRRPRGLVARVARVCILRLGWFPSGFRAPEGTRPSRRPDPAEVVSRIRRGHELFRELAQTLLPQRRQDLLVKHPVLGDMTLEEWMRFHVVHFHHHVKQIRRRLANG